MKLFSNNDISEYNDELENILETKKMSSETKSLLLNMLYKIENGYADYYMIKVGAKEKNQYIKKLLYIIKEECEEIVTVTPKTDASKLLEQKNKTYIIDVSLGKILVYANEKDLLYALFKLDVEYKQYKNLSDDFISKLLPEDKCIYLATQNFLMTGSAINDSEPIRDFNGWSWDIDIKKLESIKINLIYQDMFLLLEEKSRDELLTFNSDKIEEKRLTVNAEDLRKYNDICEQNKETIRPIDINIIDKAFNKTYLHDHVKDIVVQIKSAIMAIECKEDKELRESIKNIADSKQEKLKLMNNNKEFLNEVTDSKKLINKRIKDIDTILNDRDILQKEYEKRNSKLDDKYKIFSISHLAKMLEKERENLLKQLKNKNALLEPLNYIKEKQLLEKSVEFFSNIEKLQSEKELNELIIKIQKEFLKCFMVQVEQAATKEEIIKLLYEFRYYCLLPVNEVQLIKDIPELKNEIREIINALIDKSIDKKIIENVSNSISLCYNILKYIFYTRITDLEHIYLKVTKDDETVSVSSNNEKEKKYYITISLYDIKEEEEVHQEVVNNLSLLNIKLKKKIALFL